MFLVRETSNAMRCRSSRTLAAAAVVTFALLAAGCGGAVSPGVASVASSTVVSGAGVPTATSPTLLLRNAGRCLRQHDLPNLPDPTIATSGPAKGRSLLDKLALRSYPESVVNLAVNACRVALAKAGFEGGPNATASPQVIQGLLAFARCVRSRGISNFPDPNSQGSFDLAGTGINPRSLSPARLAIARACLSTAHGAVHIPEQETTSAGTGR